MGKMSDLYIEIMNLEDEFNSLLANIFSSLGYTAYQKDGIDTVDDESNIFCDLILTKTDNKETYTTYVESKFYPFDAPKELLNKAAKQLLKQIDKSNISAILVVTAKLSDELKTEFHREYGNENIQIWDIGELIAKTTNNSPLRETLLDILHNYYALSGYKDDDVYNFIEHSRPLIIKDNTLKIGHELAESLENSNSGKDKKAAIKFENLCEKALQTLFGDNLTSWKSQERIEFGYHRMDMFVRIAPTNNFWKQLSADFKSRYVVFEFKNYQEKISQNEIFVTEKYLYPKALRSIAIIIARNGINDSAERTIRGALREEGKLILNINLNELCLLLREWDMGNDPTNLLIEKVDQLLLSISR